MGLRRGVEYMLLANWPTALQYMDTTYAAITLL